MFGSDFAERFGLPGFPWTQMDPAGGLFGGGAAGGAAAGFPGMAEGVPGIAAGAPPGGATTFAGGGATATRGSAPDAGNTTGNPSVDALRSGNPLAAAYQGAGPQLDMITSRLGPAGDLVKQLGAGSPPSPGAGMPAGGGGRGV